MSALSALEILDYQLTILDQVSGNNLNGRDVINQLHLKL